MQDVNRNAATIPWEVFVHGMNARHDGQSDRVVGDYEQCRIVSHEIMSHLLKGDIKESIKCLF